MASSSTRRDHVTASSDPDATLLIDRLNQLFEREGFAHLTVGGLAAHLGCSRRAFYELAPSKDALLATVIEHNYEHHYEDARAAVYGRVEPTDRLNAFFEIIRRRNEARNDQFVVDVIATPSTNRVRFAHVAKMLDLLGVCRA